VEAALNGDTEQDARRFSDQDTITRGWFKATRSDDALELIRANPLALALAYVIAARAKWRNGFCRHDLKFGEAFIGDHENYGMSERNYRTAKDHLSKWGFATFKATNRGTVASLIDTRLFVVIPSQSDGQNANDRHAADDPADRPPTTNLELKSGERKNQKALSTKASKLSKAQRELARRIEEALGDEWVNDAGKWINRVKAHPSKTERVIAEVELAAREHRIKTTPARYAEQIWKEFTP
jgi:hypothetical protein